VAPSESKKDAFQFSGRGTQIMRKLYKTLLLIALLGLAASSAMTASQAEKSLAQAHKRPNIILILADDLDKASTQEIGRLRKYIGNKGATFNNAFVSQSVC
jgi:N-acetylglucosamine-6-sulfatase